MVDGSATVGSLQAGEGDEWDALVAANPHGTIYHTMAWKAVTEEGLGHRPYYLRALDGAGQVVGVLPLFLVKGVFGRRLVSVPMRDRGGVLAADSQTTSLLLAHAVQLTKELRCQYLELRSLEDIDSCVSRQYRLQCERYWTTTRIDLSPGVKRLWAALDRDAIRWAINKARKNGMTVNIDNTAAGLDTFYDLFVRARHAMGIPPFPKSLFVSIWRHLISQGKANLFVVSQGTIPIHAMINMLSKDTFIPAYAAPQNHWRKYYPNEFMFWHTIEWAAGNGYRTYDFGADSPHQTGLLWFKQKWGGVQHPMFYNYFLNGADKPPSFDSSSATYQSLRRLWKLLPLSLSKKLGSQMTRQMS